MNKIKHLCYLALVASIFSGCTLSEEDINNSDKPVNPGTVVNGVMKNITLSGIVRDTDGNPVAGVTVSSGKSVETTNVAGLFTFSTVDVVSNRSVVRFSKPGYFDVVRSVESEVEDVWEVVVCKKGNGSFNTSKDFDSSSSSILKVGGMKVELTQNGYVVDSTGKSFNGEVNADMLYLDPNNENFAEMMPGGDLAAVRTNGDEAQLVSYGMTCVNLTDNDGHKLQLKDGSPATLTFPIPEGMATNPPASIPLWSFNESTGLWEEEGEAILKDNLYIGQVKHFSWWNLDYPEEQAKIEGYVKNDQGRPVPTGTVINVGQITTRTKANGYYEQTVPADEDFEISIKSKNYGNYRNVFSLPVKALKPKEIRKIDITLPTLQYITGRIVNNAGGSNFASIYLSYGNKKSVEVVSNREGNFELLAPDGYRGDATLNVTTVDGDIVTKNIMLDGHDVDAGDIIISSQSCSGGQVVVKLNDGSIATIDLDFSQSNEYGNGVMIMDNRMIVMNENSENEYFEMWIEGYESLQNSYDNVLLSLATESQRLLCENAKVSVGKNSGKYIFDIGGIGVYYFQDEINETYIYDEQVQFSGNKIAMDLIMSAKSYRNVNPMDYGAPDFTPVLSSNAPLMYVISEGYLGTGVQISYNGSKNDFETLKTQAGKSGIKKISELEESGYVEVLYYSKNKLITLEYDPYGDTIDENFDPFEDSPKIAVMAMENVPENFGDFFGDTRSYTGKDILGAMLKRQNQRKKTLIGR